MDVTVIIACLNSEQTIGQTIEGIITQKWERPWEVLVADNGCTDRTLDIVRRYQADHSLIRIVDASRKRGKPFALNTAIKAARGRSILFCDADDVPDPRWLATMGEALREKHFVAARMDTRLLNSETIAASRDSPQVTGLQRIVYPPHLLHAGGGTLGVRREVCIAVGGFDESLPRLQDTDFCFKVQLAGHTLHFLQDAVMHVRYRDDQKLIFRQAFDWARFNMLLSKRYRAHGTARSNRWQIFLRGIGRTAKRSLRWNSYDDAAKKRLAWEVGWHLGILRGLVQYRTSPF